ncbi:MAG: glycosyltransferase family 39 protein, partial [Actinomycetota bacterium]|nr:glycosyltransferase family 39 protein [Actinomycetota bacterium]
MTSIVEPPPTLLGEVRRLAQRSRRPSHRILFVLGGLAVVAGIALRFWSPSPLWLDETLSVDIARLPLAQIPRALSHDGSPPLYYLLLHFWMLLFGQSDEATRALSGVISVVSLPFFWLAGRRLGGRRTAWIALFVAATSPFAINYATSVRMYSLMILWSLLGFLALARALESPTPRRLVALGVMTSLLLYTHYWGLYLVAATAAWMFWRVRRGRNAPVEDSELRGVRRAFGAVVVGGLCWLPCVPLFFYQLLHTGTPWTSAAGPADLLRVFGDFAGGGPWGLLLTFVFFGLSFMGVFGRPLTSEAPGAPAGILLSARPQPRAVPLLTVMIGTLVIAVVLGSLAHSAFVARYAAVVLPLFVLLVALGIAVFTDRRAVAAILAVTCLAGVLTAQGENSSPRSEAGKVAAVLNVQAQPGDLVVYCPDQLGPAVNRLLRVPRVDQLTFPRATGPDLV